MFSGVGLLVGSRLPHADGFEHDDAVDDNQRGARFWARLNRATTLYAVGSKDPNHDAVMRIGSEAPKRRTHSSNRHESQGACRESATSNRHRYPIIRAETVRVSSASSTHCAGRQTTPSGTTPCRTNRHRAISSLRAKATIMGLRAPRAFSVRARYHCAKALSF